jgi:acyl-CoA synthetase (AMP-forming)/AMP-acid ligase II
VERATDRRRHGRRRRRRRGSGDRLEAAADAGRIDDWWILEGIQVVDEMPLPSTGKIRKTELREELDLHERRTHRASGDPVRRRPAVRAGIGRDGDPRRP